MDLCHSVERACVRASVCVRAGVRVCVLVDSGVHVPLPPGRSVNVELSCCSCSLVSLSLILSLSFRGWYSAAFRRIFVMS